MRVLVTGVSGFVGRHLVRRLVAAGDEVWGTYLGLPPDLPGIELREVDLVDAEAVSRAVSVSRPEVVLHLAGLSHVGSSWRQIPDYFRVNVLGTEHLLEAAAGVPVVFASSAEVYGAVPPEQQPLTEDREVAPASPYALTKAAAERMVLARSGTVVRAFNLVGAGQATRFALPSFAAQLAGIAAGVQPPVLRVGNLEARRDFLHVADGAEALALLVQRPRPGGVFNVASGEAHTLRELVELLLAVSGVVAEIEVDPDLLRPVDVPLLVGSASRLHALGWEPHRPLAQAVEELWRSMDGDVGSSPPGD